MGIRLESAYESYVALEPRAKFPKVMPTTCDARPLAPVGRSKFRRQRTDFVQMFNQIVR